MVIPLLLFSLIWGRNLNLCVSAKELCGAARSNRENVQCRSDGVSALIPSLDIRSQLSSSDI